MSEQSIHHYSATQRFLRLAKWVMADLTILFGSYILAFSARSFAHLSLDYLESLVYISFAVIITSLCLYAHNVYKIYWQRTSGHSIRILITSIFWGTVIFLIIDLNINPRPVPLSVIIVANILTFGGLVVVRYRSRLIPAITWRWRLLWFGELPPKTAENERVLIVGAGESGQLTALRLRHRLGNVRYDVIGFVDDDTEKHGMFIERCPVFGFTSNIPEIVDREKIDLIIVAIHNIEGQVFRKILELCEKTTARIKIVPDMLNLLDSKFSKGFLRDVQPEDIIGRKIISKHEAIDLTPVTNRVVMITGAAGSIGSELATQILQFHSPKVLILVDNNESGLYDICMELQALYPHVEIVQILLDISQYEMVRHSFSVHRPELVFHAAAYKHVPILEDYPDEALRVNIGGTLNVAEAAIINGAERFVLISTDKAVNPSSVMGASKRVCELLIHALAQQNHHSTLFTAVRFGNVLGSRGSVVPLFNSQIDRGGPVTVTDEGMTRYFMSISEAVNLVIHAAAMTQGGDLFILKMGEAISIYELAERMIRMRGLRLDRDIEIVITGSRQGEKMHEELHNGTERLVATPHPGIRKLSNWQVQWDSEDFMVSVRQLVQGIFLNVGRDDKSIQMLFEICQCDHDLETAMD
jgi:FlaA1/EpsC-like NDP-sugar epimerase